MQDALVSECEIAEEGESASLAPWILAPYRLISWWDMQKFSAEAFVTIGSQLQMLKEEIGFGGGLSTLTLETIVLDEVKREEISKLLSYIEIKCSEVSLRISAGCVAVLRGDLLAMQKIPRDFAMGRISALQGTINVEMKQNLFLSVPQERAIYYTTPLREWEQILSRFSKLASDVEECSRCFACDRYAGSIFHALLIAEFGVIEVAKLFGVEGDKPGWGALERLERINTKPHKDKSDLEKKHAQFLGNVMPLMLAVKDSWRHKISHVENKLIWMDTVFSPQIAEEIISATRGFMRRLATDLPV